MDTALHRCNIPPAGFNLRGNSNPAYPLLYLCTPGIVRTSLANTIFQESSVSYSRVITAIVCAVASATCLAQINTSFSVVNTSDNTGSTGFWDPTNIYAIDVNNDGIPDLLQDMKRSGSQNSVGIFGVSIANGDGTFKPAVAYNYPTGILLAPMTFGDFNGDGRVDIAISAVGKNYLAIYLGNGDGTFQAPKNSVITLNSGQSIAASPLVAADFNHDGHIDLAIVGSDTTNTTVYILPGNGTATFGAVQPVFTAPTGGSVWGSAVHNMILGDFDGDANADIALTTTTTNSASGAITSTTVHVLYGEGNYLFTPTAPFNVASQIELNSGDLNSDGRTDLFALDLYSKRLDSFYGQSGRTFSMYSESVPQANYSFSQYTPALPMADFNNDGRMDLVTTIAEGGKVYMMFFLAGSSPGQFTAQTWNISTYTSTTEATEPVVADFNRDNKPDFAFVESWASATIHTGLNKTANGNWSNCSYPWKGNAISVCSPAGTSTPTVNFNATSSSWGQLRKMELWVDGKKLTEQHHVWEGYAYLSSTSTLASGTHKGTIYAANIDNSLKRFDFNFTVGASPCSAPPSAGVHICAPAVGSTTSANPVLVEATSKITGTLARMEVWVDGVKKYTETNSTSLAISLNIPSGSHTFTVFAVNTSGTVWHSNSTATVP